MKSFPKASVLLSLLILSGCDGQASPEAGDAALRLVVFVGATNEPRLNEDLAQKYLKPLYQRLLAAEKPFEVTIYPISANTEGETAMLRFSHAEEWLTETDAANLSAAFGELLKAYERVYPPGSSYLVDVLGTAVLLDSELGVNRKARTEVLYLSDMIQQDDVNGYDFTEYARGKNLEQCRAELPEELGPNLHHRDLFRGARVHLVYLGLDSLRRGKGAAHADTGPVTRSMNEIKTFWDKDFFRSFLGVQDVLAYSGTIDEALDNIFSEE